MYHYKKIKSQRKTAKEKQKNYKTDTMNRMAMASLYLSIMNLNVNEFSSPIKIHKVAGIKKSTYMLFVRDSL